MRLDKKIGERKKYNKFQGVVARKLQSSRSKQIFPTSPEMFEFFRIKVSSFYYVKKKKEKNELRMVKIEASCL